MGFFESLGAGLGFGAGGAAGWNIANHFVQPPREVQVGTEVIGNVRLTVMQRDAWGQSPTWTLHAIWDGQADLVGRFTSWPELQAGISTFEYYLSGGGNREHFWALVHAPEGTPIVPTALQMAQHPDCRPVDYPVEPGDPAYAQDVVDLDSPRT